MSSPSSRVSRKSGCLCLIDQFAPLFVPIASSGLHYGRRPLEQDRVRLGRGRQRGRHRMLECWFVWILRRGHMGGFASFNDLQSTWKALMYPLFISSDVILEMDRFAREDHSHIATEEKLLFIVVCWWISSNLVNSDTMPTRRRPDFKKALSTPFQEIGRQCARC